MKFKTIAEAFNFYRNHTTAQLEQRAAEIKNIIDTDASADVDALNIELSGIKQAKDNNSENEKRAAAGGFNVITGAGTAPAAKKTFEAATVCDTPEYRSAFYKTMLGQQLTEVEKDAYNVAISVAEKRADAFNASGDSMAVLPTATLNEVIKKARNMGGLIGECRAFNIPSKIAIPIGTPGTKANWHVEGAEVETEKAATASVTFDGYEIIKIFSISAKVRKMSIAAFEAYLVDELTACVMECINDALINGTGSGQGTGLETGVTWVDGENAISVDEEAKLIDWRSYTTLISMLKAGYAAGAKFACNNAFLWGTVYGLKDNNNRPLYQPDITGQGSGKLFGFDIVIDDNIPANTIYFGNFAKYLGYNMPDGIVIEASTQSSFKKGLIDYRAMAIADCKPIVAEAFVKMYIAG